MLSPVRPTVFKCQLRITQAADQSPTPSDEKAHACPFPAWPEIDDPYQPCCLPTLTTGAHRARYFLNRGLSVDVKKAAKKALAYLKRQKAMDPGIRERAIAAVKAHQAYYRHFPIKLLNQPAILYGPGRNIINISNCVDATSHVVEAAIQALIYGNFHRTEDSNFYGPEETFAFAHEYGHVQAGQFFSGLIFNEYTAKIHTTLCKLTVEDTPSKEVMELWIHFDRFNAYISDLAEKFEPLEEIYATYVGLRLLPREIRNAIDAPLKEVLRDRNWLRAYEDFAKICDDDDEPTLQATVIFDAACRMVQWLNNGLINTVGLNWKFNSTNLLQDLLRLHNVIGFKIDIIEGMAQEQGLDVSRIDLDNVWSSLNVLKNEGAQKIDFQLAQADRDFSWFASAIVLIQAIPHLTRMSQDLINKDVSYHCSPQVTLFGWERKKCVSFAIENDCGHEWTYEQNPHIPTGRLFFESLRQQLSQYCAGKGDEQEGHKLVCPFSFMKQCCGYKDRMQRLYDRLPEEDKRHFQPPQCDLPFEGYHPMFTLHPMRSE